MRRSRILAFAVVAGWCAAVAAACGLDEGGTLVGESPDGSIPSDGATLDGQILDGTTSDSPIVTGDGGATDGSIDASSPPDAGKPYLCGATPVGNCTTDCVAAPILCGTTCVATCIGCGGTASNYQCDACFSDGGRSVSVCEPQDAAAFASCLNGQTRCTCSDQSDCPGANQTCNGGGCFECGEPDAGNLNSTCKIGTHACKTDPGHLGQCF